MCFQNVNASQPGCQSMVHQFPRLDHRWLCLATLTFACFASPLIAQENAQTRIARAAVLNDQGDWRACIALLEPVVQSSIGELTPSETAVAWNLLALAYQYVGEYEKARQGFEAALSAIKAASAPAEYASLLANFGALQLELGQYDSAKRLFSKAKMLDETTNDQIAAANVYAHLAAIAIAQRHCKDARRILSEAFRRAARVSHVEADDLGTLYAVQSTLDIRLRDFRAALDAIQKAIEMWTQRHGMGDCAGFQPYHIIRGTIYGRVHEYGRARADLENALSCLARSPGANSPVYLVAEFAYAGLLRKSGSKEKASRLEKQASSAFQELRRRGCSQCTVNILGLD